MASGSLKNSDFDLLSGRLVGHVAAGLRQRSCCLSQHGGFRIGRTCLALLLVTVTMVGAAIQNAAAVQSTDDSATAEAADTPKPSTSPPENPFPRAVPVPEGILDGGTEWLNTSHPISLKELRGKIVILDFWTYCCINCMHVLPDLKYLEEKYGRQLVVIGVHSAKFENEKLSQNIRDAILRYEIQHPVVNDSEMLIWRKFGTRAWPTLALVDPEGKYVGSQGGEGNRELFDEVVGKLVEYHRWKGTLDENPIVFGLESAKVEPTPLRFPGKVLADASSDRVFVSDSNHNRILISSLAGELQDVVGSGRIGRKDGSFAEAEFDHPQGLALDGQKLYVADTENHLLRVIDLQSKTVSTLAGTGQQGRPGRDIAGALLETSLNSPWSLAHVNGTLFIAMAGPHQIWSHKIGTDQIGVYAGSGREDVINGSLSECAFAQPSEIVADASGQFLYVVDSEGSAIRRVPTSGEGLVTTIAGTSELPRGQSLFAFGDVDAVGSEARFQHPLGIAVDGDKLYVADSYNHKIKIIEGGSGKSVTWLGTGKPGKDLAAGQMSEPGGLSISGGRLFIADTNNHRICVADLNNKSVSELVIAGLTVPSPVRSVAAPDEPNAIQVSPLSVKTGSLLDVNVSLTVPEGYKLNDLAPVTWEVFAESDQAIVPADALAARDEATVNGSQASFQLPMTAVAGEATLLFRVSYGFCSENSTVCRLATAAWKVPITVSDEAEGAKLSLTFPPLSLMRPEAGVETPEQ